MRAVEIGWLDRQLKIFDLESPYVATDEIEAGTELSKVTFCVDGTMRVGAFDGRIGSFDAEAQVHFVEAHEGMVTRLICLSDGRTVSSGQDGKLLISDGRSVASMVKALDQSFRYFDPLPDGSGVLASSGREVWRVGYDGSASKMFETQLDDIWRLTVVPDSGLILLASSGAGSVEIRKIDGGKVTPAFRTHIGITNAINSLWIKDRIVTGGTLGTTGMLSLSIWDISGHLQTTVKAHTAMLLDIAVDPEAELVASGGDDDSVQLWDAGLTRVGPPLIRTSTFVAGLAISSKRDKLAAVSGTKVYVAHFSADYLLTKACTRLLAAHRPQCSSTNPDAACAACGAYAPAPR